MYIFNKSYTNILLDKRCMAMYIPLLLFQSCCLFVNTLYITSKCFFTSNFFLSSRSRKFLTFCNLLKPITKHNPTFLYFLINTLKKMHLFIGNRSSFVYFNRPHMRQSSKKFYIKKKTKLS